MAIKLENKTNVMPPDGTYPYGDIKDNSGLNDGTPVNRAVYADLHQFFAKMLDASGIAANGLPENLTNGFQYFLALIANIRATSASETARGTAEIATTVEVLAGLDDTRMVTPLKLSGLGASTTNRGIIEIATQPEVDAGTDIQRAVVPQTLAARTATETRTGIAEIATQAETNSGSDDARIVTPLKLATLLAGPSWNTVGVAAGSSYGTNWGSSSGVNIRFKYDVSGRVLLSGRAQKNGSGTTICTLPSGYRPAVAINMLVTWVQVSQWITINTDGTIITDSGITTGTPFYFDQISFPVD